MYIHAVRIANVPFATDYTLRYRKRHTQRENCKNCMEVLVDHWRICLHYLLYKEKYPI